MAKILNLYKGTALLASEEVVGEKTSVTISELTPETNYPAGTYKVSFENDAGESAKVDVPEFTTTASSVAPEPEA